MPVNSDIELACHFSPAISDAYREAVEFTNVLPSHALVRFRAVLEGMITIFSHRSHRPLSSDTLYAMINELSDQGVVKFGFKNRCHEIRQLCNPSAHATVEVLGNENVDDLRQRRANLTRNALRVRTLILEAMKDLYRLESGAHAPQELKQVIIETQEWKDVLFDAVVSDLSSVKYKAGLWCEAEAERYVLEFKGFLVDERFVAKRKFLNRLATTFYQASYLLKANTDAMYRYAKLVMTESDTDEARSLIAKAANAGHGEACDHHAAILYEDKKDYQNAERLWLLAASKNVTRAYSCLAIVHGAPGKVAGLQPCLFSF